MKAKKTKTLIATLGIITMSLTMGVIFSIGKESMGTLKSKAEEAVVDTITWSSNSTCTTHTTNSRTYTEQSNRGTFIYMYSHHDVALNPEKEVFMASSSSDDYCIKIVDSSDDNPNSPFYFQSITNLSITTSDRSLEGASFQIYVFSHNQETYPFALLDSTSPGQTYNFNDLTSYHSIVIRSNSTLAISSIAISYSCSPSSNPIRHSIGYYEYVNFQYVELEHVRINESILPEYGIEGEYIEIVIEVEFGYQIGSVYADDYISDDSITSIGDNGKRFVMAYKDLKIGIEVFEIEE